MEIFGQTVRGGTASINWFGERFLGESFWLLRAELRALRVGGGRQFFGVGNGLSTMSFFGFNAVWWSQEEPAEGDMGRFDRVG